MKKLFLLFAALVAAFSTWSQSPASGTVAEVVGMATNTQVQTQGYVIWVSGKNVYVQDSTAGILAYTSTNATCHIGDYVAVSGKKTVYNGAPEISSAQITSAAAAYEMPGELAISLDSLLAHPLQHFSERVHVENVTVDHYDANGNIWVRSTGVQGVQGVQAVQGYYVMPDQTKYSVGTVVNLHLVAGYYNKLQFVGLSSGVVLPSEDGPELLPDSVLAAVDLGLPSGRKWANMNVGAETSLDYGSYFQWGCTDAMQTQGWAAYCYGTENALTRYCTNMDYGMVDNATVLDAEDDAATRWMGSLWRTPTKEEAEELWTECTHEMVQSGNVVGYRFTGPNGNSIVLPCNGWMGTDGSISEGNSAGQYWTASLYEANNNGAWGLIVRNYNNSGVMYGTNNRQYSRGVRAVFAAPSIGAPESGTLRVAIRIPANTECHGIALKGTLDGNTWSGENTYLGADGAATSAEGSIYRFAPVGESEEWFSVDIPASSALQFKVCLIYSGDYNWQGQAQGVSYLPEISTLALDDDFSLNEEGQYIGLSAAGGLLCLSIDGWRHSNCVAEPFIERTVTVTVPECGMEVPAIVGSFNSWQPTQYPMDLLTGNTYTLTVPARTTDQFKFAGSVSGWDNQIKCYNSSTGEWEDNPDNRFDDQTDFFFDFSNTRHYRWTNCDPIDELDASLVIDGDFSDWVSLPAGRIAHAEADENAVYQSLYNAKFVSDTRNIAFYLEYDSAMTSAIDFYLDVDCNSQTGFNTYVWNNAGADFMLECWIGDGENLSAAELYMFDSEDQDDWSWAFVNENTVSACEPVLLPNGHYAVEGVIKKGSIPSLFAQMKIGVTTTMNWDNTGVLPQITYMEDESSYKLPLLYVPIYYNRFIELPPQSGVCGDDLSWNWQNDTLTISGTGPMYDYDYSGQPWYAFRDDIVTLIVNEGVTGIGTYAFYLFENLGTPSLPESLDSIGDLAFGCCAFDSVMLPAGLKKIGSAAFLWNSHLRKVNLPDSLSYIGPRAFNDTGLRDTVVIPASVTYIGKAAFSGCLFVPGMRVDAGNSVYDSRNNCNAVIKSATNQLLFGCYSSVIPDDVVEICDYAFDHCMLLPNIDIPASVRRIGENAFGNTYYINSITIPNTVTEIGEAAFYSSRGLVSATLPDNLTKIPDGLFMFCSKLRTVNIPAGVDSIGDDAFYMCPKLKIDALPDGVRFIGEYAFSGCDSLTSIVTPNSLQFIGEKAFYNCKNLTTVTLGSGLTDLGTDVFGSCANIQTITCYAVNPPTLSNTEATLFTKATVLYVPAASLAAYEADDEWGKLDVRPMGGTDIDLLDGANGTDTRRKAMINGQLYLIAPDGTRYDATGKKVE